MCWLFAGHCSHCLVPIRKLRMEHNARMFFDEGASNIGIAKAKRDYTSRMSKSTLPFTHSSTSGTEAAVIGSFSPKTRFKSADYPCSKMPYQDVATPSVEIRF